MNLFQQVQDYIVQRVVPSVAGREEIPASVLEAITVEFPREKQHGDLSTNAAMVLAKPLQKSPKEIAEAMMERLRAFRMMSKVEIAGPGFINMSFEPAFWQSELKTILKEGLNYGESRTGRGVKVNVEYVSANPTGPMHIGHARGAVVGDALARLLDKAAYDVVREYYINDAGSQVVTLARSAYLRYREAYGEAITIPEGMYPGEYLVEVGRELKEAYGGMFLGEEEADWLPEIKRFAVDAMMQRIREDLKELGVEHNIFTSEQSLHEDGWLEKGIDILDAKGLIYRGVLEPPKGKTPEDWEPAEQTLFKSTDFGDDSDRPVKKSDGNYTYFAGDIGYTAHKIERGFDTLVMVLGADHGGYVSRMKALTHALSDGNTDIKIQLCQMVKLMDGGEQVKMSKRSGSFVTVREVTDEVGKDVLRFMMLTRKPEQQLDFDLQKVKEQSRENPVFYVQYAHARCHSVLRMAQEQMPEAVKQSALADGTDLSLLTSQAELELMKLLASFPRAVEAAARAFEPHRIAYYVQEVAAEFHAFWNKGGEDVSLRFIVEGNSALTAARLALARCVALVIATGLDVLGVEALEEMR